jgi:hypothetical protein
MIFFSNALHYLHLNENITILGDFNVNMLQNSAITKRIGKLHVQLQYPLSFG